MTRSRNFFLSYCLFCFATFTDCSRVGLSIEPHEGDERRATLTPDIPPAFSTIKKAAETQSIEMTLEMPRVVRFGQAILVDLSVVNGRNETIMFNHSEDSDDFYVELFDLNGKKVPLTEYGKKHAGCFPYEYTHNFRVSLQQGRFMKRQYDLTEYFKINAVGSYRLRVLKTVAGTDSFREAGEELELEINRVTFDVVDITPYLKKTEKK